MSDFRLMCQWFDSLVAKVSLLPNWLMFICEWLFIMKSGRQVQLQVQKWYFYFLVVSWAVKHHEALRSVFHF